MLDELLAKLNILIAGDVLISRIYVLGTTLGLQDKNAVLRGLGKPSPECILYMEHPTVEENKAILEYYVDLSGIDLSAFSNILHSRRRVCANVVRYLSHKTGEDKMKAFKLAVDKSVEIFSASLRQRIKDYEATYPELLKALNEVTAISLIQLHDIKSRFVTFQHKVDLMNLGIVNEYDDGSCEIIQDSIVLDVFRGLASDDAVFLYYVDQLQMNITGSGYKSTDKVNPFQDAVLAFFQTFNGKKLFDIDFIQENVTEVLNKRIYKQDLSFWLPVLKDLQFNCKRVGSYEQLQTTSDLDALQNEEYFLKPLDQMHPDGCKVFKRGEYFFFLGVKISYGSLEKSVHDDNLASVEMNRFYVDKYKKDENAEATNQNAILRKAFFLQYPPEKIKGIIRVLFEYPQYLNRNTPHCWFGEEIVEQYKIPTLTIVIDKSNIETFWPYDNTLNEYLRANSEQWGQIEDEKRGIKRKLDK